MKESVKDIILYYKNYLMKKIVINNMKSNTNNELIHMGMEAKKQFKKIDDLSIKYKLYDENYNDFMIAMGKFALCVEEIDKFNLDTKGKEDILQEFINLHQLFEELEQVNIMKDVYVWKFVN